MSNLARDFQNTVARKQLESATKESFEDLKKITITLYDQNLALKEMLERLMKESLVGNISIN